MSTVFDNSRVKIEVHRPDARCDDTLWTILKALVAEVVKYRWHIWINFKRDFMASYKQTGLGMVWNFVLPLIPATVYLLLTQLRIFPHHRLIEPVVYITIGITFWLLFTGAITIPMNTVEKRGAAIAKTAYPLFCAVVASFAQLCFDTGIRVVFVSMVFIYCLGIPPAQALLLPIALLPALLLFLGIGLSLSILNAIYQDVSKLTNIVLRYGIFLSSVIFPLPKADIVQTLVMFNPFNTFIENLRYLLVFGRFENLPLYTITSLIGLAVFVLGCKIFYVMEYRIRGFV